MLRILYSCLLLMCASTIHADTTIVYCFSGLGADERAFARLELPQGYEARYIQWIRPERNESLEHYALRLANQIDATRPYSFLGVSFGGIVALSLSKQLHPKQVLLISSLSQSAQRTGVLQFLGNTGLYRIFPFGLFMLPNKFVYEAFGAEDPATKKMLAEILKDTSIPFFRWAVGQMSKWESPGRPANSFHIHGGADRIIPPEVAHADVLIPGAGHLMIFDHADTVNKLLAAHLQ